MHRAPACAGLHNACTVWGCQRAQAGNADCAAVFCLNAAAGCAQGDCRTALRRYRQAYVYLSWTTFKHRTPDGDVELTRQEEVGAVCVCGGGGGVDVAVNKALLVMIATGSRLGVVSGIHVQCINGRRLADIGLLNPIEPLQCRDTAPLLLKRTAHSACLAVVSDDIGSAYHFEESLLRQPRTLHACCVCICVCRTPYGMLRACC
jgi:hypothetical protein